MSPLRKCLKHPGLYLGLLVLAAGAVWMDSLRTPQLQLSARAYVVFVHVYQHASQPMLGRYVQCRFQPTCSRYSIAAVQKFGLRKGLVLTGARLWRCRASVPLGTTDPVP